MSRRFRKRGRVAREQPTQGSIRVQIRVGGIPCEVVYHPDPTRKGEEVTVTDEAHQAAEAYPDPNCTQGKLQWLPAFVRRLFAARV